MWLYLRLFAKCKFMVNHVDNQYNIRWYGSVLSTKIDVFHAYKKISVYVCMCKCVYALMYGHKRVRVSRYVCIYDCRYSITKDTYSLPVRARYGCLSWVWNVTEVLPLKSLCWAQYRAILHRELSKVYRTCLYMDLCTQNTNARTWVIVCQCTWCIPLLRPWIRIYVQISFCFILCTSLF